jgi:hypothetical protein
VVLEVRVAARTDASVDSTVVAAAALSADEFPAEIHTAPVKALLGADVDSTVITATALPVDGAVWISAGNSSAESAAAATTVESTLASVPAATRTSSATSGCYSSWTVSDMYARATSLESSEDEVKLLLEELEYLIPRGHRLKTTEKDDNEDPVHSNLCFLNRP